MNCQYIHECQRIIKKLLVNIILFAMAKLVGAYINDPIYKKNAEMMCNYGELCMVKHNIYCINTFA